MQAIYDFLECNEQYGDDWTEAKAWLKETSLMLQKLGWIPQRLFMNCASTFQLWKEHTEEFRGKNFRRLED